MLEPVGFTLAEGEQDAASQLTVNVMMHLHAWRPFQLQIVADAFSTQFEIAITPQELAVEQLACTLNETAAATASGPLPDAGAQLRACFVSYGPAQASMTAEGAVLTARAVATAFAENSLVSWKAMKNDGAAFSAGGRVPAGCPAQCRVLAEHRERQCSCAGGTLEVTVTARAEGAILCRTVQQGIGSIELGDELTPLTRRSPCASTTRRQARSCSPLRAASMFHRRRCGRPTVWMQTCRPCRRRSIFWCRVYKLTKNAAVSRRRSLCVPNKAKPLSSPKAGSIIGFGVLK